MCSSCCLWLMYIQDLVSYTFEQPTPGPIQGWLASTANPTEGTNSKVLLIQLIAHCRRTGSGQSWRRPKYGHLSRRMRGCRPTVTCARWSSSSKCAAVMHEC